MRFSAQAALFLALSATLLTATRLPAQQTRVSDPANLSGEHIAPQAPADFLPLNHGAPALQQLLLKLRTRASLLLIVAHPDDEDGGLLTFESRGEGARVGMLTLTRGEGGQNLMTADFNDALGLIRTQELLAADRYLGVDQFFGTEVDFGFSKTKEESFAQWTHQRVLYDAVRAVRLYRPLVLASVFVGGVTDGHGHHQVAGEITQEVFLAAADPTIFPDQNLPPWAPLAVYARVPFSRVTSAGMYDYATGKSVPPLFHNYITGVDISHEPAATVEIHEGDQARIAGVPALAMQGLSYVQFARLGLAFQKTQIGPNARLAQPGPFNVGYTLMAARCGAREQVTPGCPTLSTPPSSIGWGLERSLTAVTDTQPAPDLFSKIDTTLLGISSLAPSAPTTLPQTLLQLDHQLAEAQRLFTPDNPALAAPPLRQAMLLLNPLIQQTEARSYPQQEKFNLLHELYLKRVQLNQALILADQLTLSAVLSPNSVQQSSSTSKLFLTAELTVANSGPEAVQLESAGLRGVPGGNCSSALFSDQTATLAPGNIRQTSPTCDFEQTPSPTTPYFSRPNLEQPYYTLSNQSLRNAAETPAPLVAFASVLDHGLQIVLEQTVVSAPPSSPPQPAFFLPRLSLSVKPVLAVIPDSSKDRKPVPFAVEVTTTVAGINPRLELSMPDGWQVTGSRSEHDTGFTLAHARDSHTYRQMLVVPETTVLSQSSYLLGASAAEPPLGEQAVSSLGYKSIGYPGLTRTNFYQPAQLRVVSLNVSTAPGLRVAYLPGTGDDVPAYLPNLGITPTLLTPADLTPARLAQFDAVLLGVRAYSAHPDLNSKALLDYAAQGGTVIVQYNNAVYAAKDAPYPIEVPGDPAHNVVVEAEPVHILLPTAPVLTWPNRITPADFNGWTEERGHGFASSWDPQYQALLEVHDPDQDPQAGGLLLAKVGKGAYIYVALALYRQLPEGVPGAYRLLANLLSLSRNPNH